MLGLRVLVGACLLGPIGSGIARAQAGGVPAALNATLLPAARGSDGSQLAVAWSGTPGARLSATVQGPGTTQVPLVTAHELHGGVNLVPLAIDAQTDGKLALRVEDPAGDVVAEWNRGLDELRGASGFAWEAAFYGPGVDDGDAVLSGGVSSMLVWDDGSGPALYVGGGFITAGPGQVTRIARWDGTTWSALAGPNGTGVEIAGAAQASVKALEVFDGKLIVAGFFDTAGGDSVNNIASWDGESWAPLGAGLEGGIGIESLLVYDGALVAGGTFTESGGEPVPRIARWDGGAWSAVGGGVSEAEFSQTVRVDALAEYDGELVAGGNFLMAGDTAVQRIARWNGSTWAALGSGVADASNPTAELPSVRALRVFGGDLFVGGNFTTAGGQPAQLIARWDGAAWSPLGSGLGGEGNPSVRALAVHDGALIVGGNFAFAGATSVQNIARWDGGAWSALAGSAGEGVSSGVSSLASFDGNLVVAGRGFAFAGGIAARSIARWDGAEWGTLSGQPGTGLPGPGIPAQVNAMTLYDGDLVIGGVFGLAGSATVHNVARWDGVGWHAFGDPPGVDGLPGGGVSPSVEALAVYHGDLIVGGKFLVAGNTLVRHIARWDGSAWSGLQGPGSGVANSAGPVAVSALYVEGDDLIVAGQFGEADGVAAANIARWNGSAWSSLGAGTNGAVEALTGFDGTLVAAGSFNTAGGVSANAIARWDGSSWSALAGGLNGPAYALAEYDGQLVAGGNFSRANGHLAARIARWDGSDWFAMGAGVDGNVDALAVYAGELVVGGRFEKAGGDPVHAVARWNGTTWSALAGPAGVGVGGYFSSTVAALAAFDADGAGAEPEKLIAGGQFNLAGGVAAWSLARYAPAAVQGNLVVAPRDVDFGPVYVTDSATPRTVVLTSLGNTSVTVASIDAANAPFLRSGGDCPAAPFPLAPTESCTIEYGFVPTGPGDFAQAVTIATDAGPTVVELSGTGEPLPPPFIVLDPESVSLDLVHGTQGSGSLTISNGGGEPLEWMFDSSGALGCDALADVSWLDAATSSGSVPRDGSADVTLDFDAAGLAIGDYDANLCIASNDPLRPLADLPVVLHVTGTFPVIDVDPDNVAGSVAAGAVATATFDVHNHGEQTLEWSFTEIDDTVGIPEFGASVNALAVWDDGRGPALYAAGSSNTEFDGIGRWNGSRWETLDSGFDSGTVYALAVYDGDLIAGGSFGAADGVAVSKIARWDGHDWSPLGSGIAGSSTTRVNTLAVYDGELIAGGTFTEAGGVTVNGIARWNGSSWAALGAGLTTQTYTMTVYGGKLIVGGGFTVVDGQTVNHIVSWDGTSWAPLGTGLDNSPLVLGTWNGRLIAGGSFDAAGGMPASRIASWDGVQWAALGAGVNTQVGALAEQDGTLIVAGLFSAAGGTEAHNIARWDGEAWTTLGAGTGGRVSAVAVFGDELVAGGSFHDAGGIDAERLAGWDGSAWSPLVALPADCARPAWLQADPAGGSVAGGASGAVDVTLDASALAPGLQAANLCLASNDPAQPITVVPVSLEVTDGGPTGPVVLTAADGMPNDWFGRSVSIDGDTAVVGADAVDEGANDNQGAAYVFVRQGGAWVQQARLVADDGAPFNQFGISVALSGDTALVGSAANAAYVFERNAGAWTQAAKLTASDGAADDVFGIAVALDGDTALVGAREANVDGRNNQGAAYVFMRSGESWSEQAKLTASNGLAFDLFGDAVALSGDVAAVGAAFADPGGNDAQGAAYVYARSGSTWTEQAVLGASDAAAGARFGSSVAASGDTVVVGANYADIGTNASQGAAYVYQRSGTNWTEQAKLVAAGGSAHAEFGNSVALDGDVAVIGAWFDANVGAAHVFRRSGTAWSETATLASANAADNDQFGNSVSVSGDTALVGAWLTDVNGQVDQGAVHVFPLEGAPAPLIDVDPDTLDFGAVLVPGAVVGPLVATLTNTDANPVQISTISNPAMPFVYAGGSCPFGVAFELAASASCTLNYLYIANEPGTFEETISIANDGATVEFTLTGTGLAPATMDLDPDSLSVELAQESSTTRDVTIANPGTVALEWSLTESGGATDCSVPGWLAAAPATGTVAPGGSEVLTATLDAAGLALGQYTANLCFASNDPFLPLAVVPVTLDVVAGTPGLAIDPAAVDFGTVPAGITAGPATFTVTSTGTAPVTVTSISAVSDPFVRAGGDCPATPFDLAPSASCTLAYSFSPTTVGEFDELVTVANTAGDATIDLSGTGMAGVPTVLAMISGDGQSTTVGTAFAEPLVVQVRDDWNNPVPNVSVTFTPPASGAGAELSATSVPTDANGMASVTATANAEAGTYTVTASGGLGAPVGFGLTNLAASADIGVTISVGSAQVQVGELVDYVVTVSNAGPDAADGVAVASELSGLLDVANASWICSEPGDSGCTPSGQGDLAESSLHLESGAHVTWVLSATVLADGDDGVVETRVEGSFPGDPDATDNSATATSQVVVFSNGFESVSVDAAEPALQVQATTLDAGAAIRLAWPERLGSGLESGPVAPVLIADACADACTRVLAGAGFRVERLDGSLAGWARLVAADADGRQRPSAWIPVAPGCEVVLAAVDSEAVAGDANAPSGRSVLLYAAGTEIWLPVPNVAPTYRLGSVVPVAAQALDD
jgi:uncharacterized repeat protein (TIGR01451 family)